MDLNNRSRLLAVRYASRGRVPHHHPVVDPSTDFGGPALAVLLRGVGSPRQAHRVSFREWPK
jgi:hypothetical protein